VRRADTIELLGKLREQIPGLTLRTTLITGFPGETDEEFAELADFVAEQKFERLGVFTYSLEPDTPAARLPNHLPDEVKEQRRDALMQIQQQVAFEWGDSQIGRSVNVLIDSPAGEQAEVAIGRTVSDAPDVDCVVYVTGDDLLPGQIVPCEVVARSDYDLVAVAVGEPR
ncbi:MAG: 30S ribosomal protein S12 methylthiotransferase RimO, partial [Planctomycetota bacterium]